MADNPLRRQNGLEIQVVCEVEQGRHEDLVGCDCFGLDRIAVAGGQALRHEASFRTDRYDHGVFNLLRLNKAQHLGAEVLRPVRPPDAPAGHRPEP